MTLRHHLLAYGMVTPAVFFLFLFLILPFFLAFRISLYDWSGFGAITNFVGFRLYSDALNDPVFRKAVLNNTLLAIADLGVSIPISFLIAYVLYKRIVGWRIYRVALFIPATVSLVVVAVMWMSILEPNLGLLNSFLRTIGLDQLALPWLGNDKTALPVIIVVWIWRTIPFNMIIFVASMERLPREVLEAAIIDGASRWQTLRLIVVPLMWSTVLLLVIVTITTDFRAFDLVYVMTGGGPANSTEIATTYIYRQAFQVNNYGYGNALAFMTFVVLAVVVWILARRIGSVSMEY